MNEIGESILLAKLPDTSQFDIPMIYSLVAEYHLGLTSIYTVYIKNCQIWQLLMIFGWCIQSRRIYTVKRARTRL